LSTSTYSKFFSGSSESVLDLEAKSVWALLGADLGRVEVLVSLDFPVAVDLVLLLEVHFVVVANGGGGLDLSRLGQVVLDTALEGDWEALEALGSIGHVVGDLEGVLDVVLDLLGAASGDELGVQVGSEPVGRVLVWGGNELSPELLCCGEVSLQVHTGVVLTLVGEVEALLEGSLALLVVFTDSLASKKTTRLEIIRIFLFDFSSRGGKSIRQN
jgi:hypothetical protein